MTPSVPRAKISSSLDFHGVTWPKIPKRNGHKKTEDTIEDALLDQITSYEYIRTQAENIGQLELRKEMIRRELACRAELAEPSFERLLRKAYGWICDHGTSIGRPALALLCIWGFTFLRLARMGRAGGGGHDLGCALPHRRADVAVCWRPCLC